MTSPKGPEAAHGTRDGKLPSAQQQSLVRLASPPGDKSLATASSSEILMAGFGGQGMLLSGKLLAYAAMYQGLEVSWLPSYGPEMRGGTANVLVCISNKPIGSPYVTCPRALLVMNQPSLEKFGPRVKPGGLIVIDSSLISIHCGRDDCSVLYVAANDLAAGIGTARAANMVMLGVYVGWSAMVTDIAIEKMIEKEFASRPKFISANRAAFRAGYQEGMRAKEVHQ